MSHAELIERLLERSVDVLLNEAATEIAALVAERDALKVQFDKCWTVLDDINMCVGNEGGNLTWPAIDLIPEQIERISRIAGKGAIENAALVAERDALREALALIANAIHPRFRAEDDIDLLYANEKAFGNCIEIARAALAQGGE